MNTKPTVSRFAERTNITSQPNTLAKAEDEGDSFKFTVISRGHVACDSGKTTHIIIDKGGEIGCSCGDMTYRCNGTDVCKHIVTLLGLDSPPQMLASGELIKKLMLMGWVGGKDDLHPAELLRTSKKEEAKMPEEETKIYTHPDGTEFPTAEALLDYVDELKEAQDMKDTKALLTPSNDITDEELGTHTKNTNMQMRTALMAQVPSWSDEQIEVMKRTVAEKATPAEFAYFMEVARCSGLNPFLREIYFMKTDKGQTAIITGRDGYLTIAKRSRRFKGIQSMDVCEKDEFEMGYSNGIMEVTKHIINDFQDRGEIIGAWARGEMDGETPVTAYASIKEYDKGTNVWKMYKSAMIKKVPESMVLKRIAGISGLVTEAEVSDSQTFVMDAEEIQ